MMSKHTIFDNLPASGYIRANDLVPHVIPFSKATLWRKVKTKEFPKPIKLSTRITVWRVKDVRAWIGEHDGSTLNHPKIKRRELTHKCKKSLGRTQ